MKEKYFDTIVKHLWKYQGKMISNEIIKKKLQNLLDQNYNDAKMYKTIYYLKLRGYLINLKKNLFFVPDTNLQHQDEENLAQLFYREVLKKHCNDIISGKRYIWGLKALELALLSYTIPEEILLVTPHKQATETIIFNKTALLKTYSSKSKNLFTTFYRYSYKTSIGKYSFQVAIPELAILETLYNPSPLQKAYGEELIKKRLRKNKKYLNLWCIEAILKTQKHNSSANRLALLASSIDPLLAENIKNLIKKYGHLLY